MSSNLAALTPPQRRVLGALTRLDVCYPPDTLVRMTRLTPEEVGCALTALRGIGLVRQEDAVAERGPIFYRATKNGRAEMQNWANSSTRIHSRMR